MAICFLYNVNSAEVGVNSALLIHFIYAIYNTEIYNKKQLLRVQKLTFVIGLTKTSYSAARFHEHISSCAHIRNVLGVMPNCFAADRPEISLFHHASHNAENASDLSIRDLPKRTPFARAMAMPSACLCFMNSRSA